MKIRWITTFLCIALVSCTAPGAYKSGGQPENTAPPPAVEITTATAPAVVAVEPTQTSVPQQPSPAAVRADLPDLGPAPELNNTVWLNTEQPLRLAGLHGRVVLIEMWTYG